MSAPDLSHQRALRKWKLEHRGAGDLAIYVCTQTAKALWEPFGIYTLSDSITSCWLGVTLNAVYSNYTTASKALLSGIVCTDFDVWDFHGPGLNNVIPFKTIHLHNVYPIATDILCANSPKDLSVCQQFMIEYSVKSFKRPTTTRRLIKGWPADRPTGSNENWQTAEPGLLDVDSVHRGR